MHDDTSVPGMIPNQQAGVGIGRVMGSRDKLGSSEHAICVTHANTWGHVDTWGQWRMDTHAADRKQSWHDDNWASLLEFGIRGNSASLAAGRRSCAGSQQHLARWESRGQRDLPFCPPNKYSLQVQPAGSTVRATNRLMGPPPPSQKMHLVRRRTSLMSTALMRSASISMLRSPPCRRRVRSTTPMPSTISRVSEVHGMRGEWQQAPGRLLASGGQARPEWCTKEPQARWQTLCWCPQNDPHLRLSEWCTKSAIWLQHTACRQPACGEAS